MTAVFGMAVLSIVVIVGNWRGRGGPEDVVDSEPPPTRDFSGLVVADGAPLAGISLTLFEGNHGPVGEATSDDEGNYVIRWTPLTTLNARQLILVGSDPQGRFARTADRLAFDFEMRRAVSVSGIVVGADGRPRPGSAVSLAVHGQRFGRVDVDAGGRFEMAGLPEGASLEAFVRGPDLAPRVFRDFHVGEFLVLHVERGKSVELSVHRPDGKQAADAVVRASVAEPFAADAPAVCVENGVARLVLASHASGLVEAFAPGYIPVFVDASTHGRTEAVLWPARDVQLRVWDGWANRGVLGIATEVTLPDKGENESWNGRDAARSWREFPLFYGPNRGAYRVRLPRTATTLALEAAGYANARVTVPPDESRLLVRMPPLQKRKSAFLKVKAAGLIAPHWMVVADKEERWFASFVVSDGEGRVRVPARRPLELASAGASDGKWLARINIKPIEANRTRVLNEPALSTAARLIVKLDPPTEAVITLVDDKFGKAVPPIRRTVTGDAKFWVRAKRAVRITIEPKGNFHTHSGDFEVELPTREWTAFLKPAAGFSLRVRDPEGRPIPSAEVSVMEALRGARINLRGQPGRHRTDATGAVEVFALRNGPTPIEIRADGFRLVRPRPLELENGKVTDAGTVRMVPAGIVRGMVTDPAGKPLPGVLLRTAGRGLRRLELPGGGARDLYDVTGGEEWDATSGTDGAFVVRDATHRLPLMVCSHPDYAITVAEVDGSGPLRITMQNKAELAVSMPSGSPVDGVYVLLSKTRAIRVHALGGLSLNPLPLTLPVGRNELFFRLRNGRWAAPILQLEEGDQRVSIDRFAKPR